MNFPEGKLVTWITMPGRITHVGRAIGEPVNDRVPIVEWDGEWVERLHAKHGTVHIHKDAVQVITRDFLEIFIPPFRAMGCECSAWWLLTHRHNLPCILHGVER